ncbi:hypothetical protein GCM10017044_09600 [Kordiimonas sediminis]|uniref:Type II secretion system protein I n=1 Tax=Kordiimonas sediminis TaxID=1735581 RepID=A0A919AP47_9PROT|nr:type II secretion system minor pseudopilin GspI [Kordiimonas sediminis]GHF17308.1 hypothetical protein GCM10017044_09600 [Kordiimonas sediminis]
MTAAQTYDEGFSLVELMMAIAILAIVGVALMSSQTATVRSASYMQTKALAQIVAANRLAAYEFSEQALVAGMDAGREEQMGQSFDWTAKLSRVQNGRLMLLRISVSPLGGRPVYETVALRVTKS